ncbi:MAG TPA: hypothetical protein VHU82_05505 [Vicinamibacterales bacterium]|nr:hypothetical protein [Vicinamibacterales bacterium]
MSLRRSPLSRTVAVVAVAAAVSLAAGCRRKEAPAPPVATASVTIDHPKAALGSPIEITYKFVPAAGATFAEDYRVMAHVVDTDEELMWADDHNPPVPTTKWKAGEPVEYTRTVFVPVYPYVGEASIEVGLYSTRTQKRLPLSGDDVGQRAYKVAHLQLVPQTENVFTLFKDGWHPAEVADKNASVEWQWTKKRATLAFKNPKKDVVFLLDLDNPGRVFREPQQVTISVNGQEAKQFTVNPAERTLQKIPLTAAQLGTADTTEVQIDVDKTYVPALLTASNSTDPRELGVRVFHAFVDAR